MQELMRHSTIRVTLDTYTQAVTTGSAPRKPLSFRSSSAIDYAGQPNKSKCLDRCFQ